MQQYATYLSSGSLTTCTSLHDTHSISDMSHEDIESVIEIISAAVSCVSETKERMKLHRLKGKLVARKDGPDAAIVFLSEVGYIVYWGFVGQYN